MTSAERQANYYTRTASNYDGQHLACDPEHDLAIALIAGLAKHCGAQSILDVGAGTGRAVALLGRYLPGVRVVGIEPVDALRDIAASKGIGADQLLAGSGDALPFPDGSFDLVIESGVLHHVAEPDAIVAEMLRVARLGVALSDSNKYGQGRWPVRFAKAIIARLGLWHWFIWLQTKGRMWKWSEGDGLFYSYSVFDNLAQIARKFPQIQLTNTGPLRGFNLRRDAAQICLIALAEAAVPEREGAGR